MYIYGLDRDVAEAMLNVFGNRIFDHIEDDTNNTIAVLLNESAILKCHGFDKSVRVELGARMFILERDNYWRIVIE